MYTRWASVVHGGGGGAGGQGGQAISSVLFVGPSERGTRKPTSPDFRRRLRALLGYNFTSWPMAASPLEAFSSL